MNSEVNCVIDIADDSDEESEYYGENGVVKSDLARHMKARDDQHKKDMKDLLRQKMKEMLDNNKPENSKGSMIAQVLYKGFVKPKLNQYVDISGKSKADADSYHKAASALSSAIHPVSLQGPALSQSEGCTTDDQSDLESLKSVDTLKYELQKRKREELKLQQTRVKSHLVKTSKCLESTLEEEVAKASKRLEQAKKQAETRQQQIEAAKKKPLVLASSLADSIKKRKKEGKFVPLNLADSRKNEKSTVQPDNKSNNVDEQMEAECDNDGFMKPKAIVKKPSSVAVKITTKKLANDRARSKSRPREKSVGMIGEETDDGLDEHGLPLSDGEIEDVKEKPKSDLKKKRKKGVEDESESSRRKSATKSNRRSRSPKASSFRDKHPRSSKDDYSRRLDDYRRERSGSDRHSRSYRSHSRSRSPRSSGSRRYRGRHSSIDRDESHSRPPVTARPESSWRRLHSTMSRSRTTSRFGFDLQAARSRSARSNSSYWVTEGGLSFKRHRGHSPERPVLNIDKQRLRETALRNVMRKMQSGEVSADNAKSSVVKSQERSLEQWTAYCRRIAQLEAEGSDDDDDPNRIRHPFKVRSTPNADFEDDYSDLLGRSLKLSRTEPNDIKISIANSKQLTAQTAEEREAVKSTFRLQFPVSSGGKHRRYEEDILGRWQNVQKAANSSVTAGANVKSAGEVVLNRLEDEVGFVDASSAGAGIVATNAEDGTEELMPAVDIAHYLRERGAAQVALKRNPMDVEALKKIRTAEEKLQQWKDESGIYSGSTGAKILSAQELQSGDKKCEPWIRQDVFTSAPPVESAVGRLLLKKMGWKEGCGLGKNNEGNVDPLAPNFKTDRKGLATMLEAPSIGYKVSTSMSIPLIHGKTAITYLVEHCSRSRLGRPEFKITINSQCAYLYTVKVNNVDYQPDKPSRSKQEAKHTAALFCLQSLGVAGPLTMMDPSKPMKECPSSSSSVNAMPPPQMNKKIINCSDADRAELQSREEKRKLEKAELEVKVALGPSESFNSAPVAPKRHIPTFQPAPRPPPSHVRPQQQPRAAGNHTPVFRPMRAAAASQRPGLFQPDASFVETAPQQQHYQQQGQHQYGSTRYNVRAASFQPDACFSEQPTQHQQRPQTQAQYGSRYNVHGVAYGQDNTYDHGSEQTYRDTAHGYVDVYAQHHEESAQYSYDHDSEPNYNTYHSQEQYNSAYERRTGYEEHYSYQDDYGSSHYHEDYGYAQQSYQPSAGVPPAVQFSEGHQTEQEMEVFGLLPRDEAPEPVSKKKAKRREPPKGLFVGGQDTSFL